jgi:hypothetical protein
MCLYFLEIAKNKEKLGDGIKWRNLLSDINTNVSPCILYLTGAPCFYLSLGLGRTKDRAGAECSKQQGE